MSTDKLVGSKGSPAFIDAPNFKTCFEGRPRMLNGSQPLPPRSACSSNASTKHLYRTNYLIAGCNMSIESQPFDLSLDKFSVTCDDTNLGQVGKTCQRLVDAANAGRLKIKSGLRHQLQCTLPIIGCDSPLLMQAGPRHSGISDYRFEFNPSMVGQNGLNQISSFIDTVTEIGTQALFSNGKITRIDFALDLPGISLDDVIVRSSKQKKHGVHTGQTGKLETVYLGSVKANRTVAYTKFENGGEFLRLERRMKPNCRGHELFSMPNPFAKVQMVSTETLVPHLLGMIPEQFFDSVRMRGIGHVIANLPTKQRKAIKAAMADPQNSLLPSIESVWRGWPGLLHHTGLGPICTLLEGLEAAE